MRIDKDYRICKFCHSMFNEDKFEIKVYWNTPSQKHIAVCDLCGTDLKECPILKNNIFKEE